MSVAAVTREHAIARAKPRLGAAAAIGLALVAIVFLVAAAALTLLDHENPWKILYATAVLTPLASGLLIALRRPENRIGWFLLVDAVVIAMNFPLAPYAHYGLITHPGSLPGARLALLFDSADWPTLFAPLVAIVLVFPDGHLPSPRWRRLVYPAVLSFLVVQLVVNLEPQHYANPYRQFTNPLPVLPAAVRVALTPFWLGAFATLFAAAWAIRTRFRRASGVERLQLLWLTYGALLIPLTVIACLAEVAVQGRVGSATSILFGAALIAIPAWVGIAVLRHRLLDIEVVLSRTLVYAALTTGLGLGYLAIFLGVDRLVRSTGASGVVAAGVVAIGFQPLRAILQRRVDRLVYGDRSDPYAAIARLGQRLQAAPDRDDLLETIVDDVSRALRLGYCAIALRQADCIEVAAERGRPGRAPAVELPLTHQGDDIGMLIVEPAPKGTLSPLDQRLLEDLARQAGVAVHGVRLMADLQRSRESLVVAREEERLRLRRDLHDGLGPTLAALVFKIGLIRDGVGDPERTTVLLGELGQDTQTAIADIRQLVYGLRPPALDELGLVGAVHEQAEYLAASSGLVVTVLSDNLPPLTPAVEVAAYRIVIEAVTNAIRHAEANRCEVALRLTNRLELRVADDGIGLPSQFRSGVGLRSMRERATELGGTFDVDSARGRGTRVFVALPVSA